MVHVIHVWPIEFHWRLFAVMQKKKSLRWQRAWVNSAVVGIPAFSLLTNSIKNLSGVFSFIAWIFSEIMISYYSSELWPPSNVKIKCSFGSTSPIRLNSVRRDFTFDLICSGMRRYVCGSAVHNVLKDPNVFTFKVKPFKNTSVNTSFLNFTYRLMLVVWSWLVITVAFPITLVSTGRNVRCLHTSRY